MCRMRVIDVNDLPFEDCIDGLAVNEHEFIDLIQCLNKSATKSEMEVGIKQTKLMTNNQEGI